MLISQDKKGRLYIVTALPDTTIDLKVLSARLGAGKGGVRLAPDDLIPSILSVQLGSVTPLAVSQPTATDVVLLLDIKLKSAPSFFVHPLLNTASLALSAADLEVFLSFVGRSANWIDLEADPKIDKENPPDLKSIADGAKPIITNDEETSTPAAAAAVVVVPQKAKKDKKSATRAPLKENAAVRAAYDVYAVTESVLDKITASTGVDAASVDGDVMRRLRADVVMELNALRNAAYAAGFKAAQKTVVASITGELS